MNQEQQRAIALANARLRLQQGGEPSVAQPAEPDRSFGSAFWSGIDAPLEAMGTTAKVFGWEKTGQALKDFTDAPTNYESASAEFLDGDGLFGYSWGHLPRAAAEQAGQFAGSLATRAGGALAGAGVGGVAGSVIPGAGTAAGAATGAATGAFAGPAAFEAMQVLGPVALERAKANGRDEPNWEDMTWAAGTATASGALNALAPGAQGFVRRMFLEGATEGAQSVIQQTGESLGTDEGLDVSLHNAVGEGILGAGSAGIVDTGIATAKGAAQVGKATVDAAGNAIESVRTDNLEGTDAELAVADRLKANADTPEALGDVSDTGKGTAKGTAQSSLEEVRAEADLILRDVEKLIKKQELGEDAEALVKTIKGEIRNHTKPVSMDQIARLKDALGDNADVDRISSLAEQSNILSDFVMNSDRDMGGISRFTRHLDFFDKRNTNRFVGTGMMVGGAGLTGGSILGTAAAGLGINRAARFIDNRTNRRSRVKRFVDSVEKTGKTRGEILGRTSRDALNVHDTQKNMDKLISQAKKISKDEQRAAVRAEAQAARAAKQVKAEAKAEASAKKLADSANTRMRALAPMFEANKADPEIPVQKGYAIWEAMTGVGPADTLDVLEQLAREGEITPDIPQRFAEQIDTLGRKGDDTKHIQDLVRQRANPAHKPDTKLAKKIAKGVTSDLAREAKVREAATMAISGKRGKDKAKEGTRRYNNLINEIERSEDSLTQDQFLELSLLAEEINSPAVTKEARVQRIQQAIPEIFAGNPALAQHWLKKFTPLATVGNDFAIEREEAKVAEKAKVEAHEKKVANLDRKPEKKTAEPTPEVAPKVAGSPTTPEDIPASKDKPEKLADVAKATDDDTPKVVNVAAITKKHEALYDNYDRLVEVNETYREAHDEMMAEMARDKSELGRVMFVLHQRASSNLTQNMLTEAYAQAYGIPLHAAANRVDTVLAQMERDGLLDRSKRGGQEGRVKKDGKFAQDADGNYLDVITLKPKGDLKDTLDLVLDIRAYDKLVDQEYTGDFTPNAPSHAGYDAIKNVPQPRGYHTPILNVLNHMRATKHRVHPGILGQINNALQNTSSKRVGTIGDVLKPKVDGSDRRDDSPLKAVAQLNWQTDPDDPVIRQEWGAGENGRIYSKNGFAHSQGGDLMKGILRSEEKAPLGGIAGFNYLMHGIGNLLGYDKEAPADRRTAIFKDDVIEGLLEFAADPFKRNGLESPKTGKKTKAGKVVADGEGFFQVLNAAHEVKAMVDWASARHKKKAKDPKKLLMDPDVQADIAANYETDFIVQLDANNNAYQIAGLLMADPEMLRATGMLPPEGAIGDPDTLKGADIYLEPAQTIASRVPAIGDLNLPATKLRKLFKNPISTYLYDSAFSSRRDKYADILSDIAQGGKVFSVDDGGLIQVPAGVASDMLGEGAILVKQRYHADGRAKSPQNVRRRVVKVREEVYDPVKKKRVPKDVYKIASATGRGKEKIGGQHFDTPDQAIEHAYAAHTYTQMDAELNRVINELYPNVRNFLSFAREVSGMVRERSQDSDGLWLTTPDGVRLFHKFDRKAQFESEEVGIGDNVFRIGMQGTPGDYTGRGFAAFIAHTHDAWALRETNRRVGDSVTFNPIHDSYGWHPSDATRGQQHWVEVMQEMGMGDYNIFLKILEDNNINLKEFSERVGPEMIDFILKRGAIEPVPAQQIPTALS